MYILSSLKTKPFWSYTPCLVHHHDDDLATLTFVNNQKRTTKRGIQDTFYSSQNIAPPAYYQVRAGARADAYNDENDQVGSSSLFCKQKQKHDHH